MKQRMRPVALASLLLASWLAGCASAPPAPQQATSACYHRNESVEREIGYCQALRSGHTLHVSGVAGAGNMDAAVRSVYGRLKEILQANGLSFANVVNETVFTTDLDAFIQNKDLRKAFYGESLPAASWVQVQRLYVPQLVLEVELTADYPR